MDGDGIKLTRKRLQMTQAQMAKELDVSRQSYIAWEKDTYKIPADKLAKLISMDNSVPEGGLDPKETPKQKAARESAEHKEAIHWFGVYRSARAYYRNHNETMALLNSQGHTIPLAAQKLIVEAFPDVLTDPGGDYPMNKQQARHAVGLDD